MALTDAVVQRARSRDKDYTLSDADGLALFIPMKGKKKWHFRFTLGNSEPRISLGLYPDISLKRARELRDEMRTLVAEGIDPRIYRREAKRSVLKAAENTFEAVYECWRDHKALSLRSGRQSTLSQIKRIFAKDVLPSIGERSIFDVGRADLLDILRKVEARKALTTAEKLRTWFNQMFRWARIKLSLADNPAADLDIVAVPQAPITPNPFLRMGQMPDFLAKLQTYGGAETTILGIWLLLLTGVRTGELRYATPDQIHIDKGLWIIPPDIVKQLQAKVRRKSNKDGGEIPPYVVPLSRQAVAIFQRLLALRPPGQKYILGHRHEPTKRISENTLNGALKRMGYKDQLTGHGIRATISTALNEQDYNPNWVEAQLSHSDPNQIRAAYNHASYVDQRRTMMQEWADRLERMAMGLSELEKDADEEPVHAPLKKPGPEVVVAASNRVEPGTETIPVLEFTARRDQRPQTAMTDIQRERAYMLATFQSVHNMVLPAFAKLVGKSRAQITREIQRGKLLALSLGNRGYRIPDWQLDPIKDRLTQEVVARSTCGDCWHVYQALTQPLDALNGRSAIEAVTGGNVAYIVELVLEAATPASPARNVRRW
jgi:integrase